MWQPHHGFVEEKQKIVGKPQEDAGQRIGHGQVDEEDIVHRHVLARNAETADDANHKDIQGRKGYSRS